MSDIITNDDLQVKDFMLSVDSMIKEIDGVIKRYKPSILDARYITDEQLSQVLSLHRRTLQEYRNSGILPYYQIGGKILYKESEIEEILLDNKREAWANS